MKLEILHTKNGVQKENLVLVIEDVGFAVKVDGYGATLVRRSPAYLFGCNDEFDSEDQDLKNLNNLLDNEKVELTESGVIHVYELLSKK